MRPRGRRGKCVIVMGGRYLDHVCSVEVGAYSTINDCLKQLYCVVVVVEAWVCLRENFIGAQLRTCYHFER